MRGGEGILIGTQEDKSPAELAPRLDEFEDLEGSQAAQPGRVRRQAVTLRVSVGERERGALVTRVLLRVRVRACVRLSCSAVSERRTSSLVCLRDAFSLPSLKTPITTSRSDCCCSLVACAIIAARAS